MTDIRVVAVRLLKLCAAQFGKKVLEAFTEELDKQLSSADGRQPPESQDQDVRLRVVDGKNQ